jgi:superfamily II DNA or RNA helicase
VAWTDTGGEVSAWSSGGLHTKLARICTALELVEPRSSSSSKMDAFEERVRDQARPSLAVGHFRATVELAAIRAARAGRRPTVVHGGASRDQRKASIRGFKQGEFDVLCATIDTLAEGLNLTEADTIHMLERSYRPTKNQQIFRRIHRIGQERPCTVLHYLSTDTVDERMLPLLRSKRDETISVLRAQAYRKLL